MKIIKTNHNSSINNKKSCQKSIPLKKMPLVTLLDLEKVNHMMHHQNLAQNQNFTDQVQNHTKTQNNLFANALLQQFQSQNKLFSNNTLILNCIQANAAHLLQTQTSENQKQINYSRYKTELCRQFIENGECKYGDKCQFAHGMHDLKDVNRHPKYKTDYCKTFHSKGFCPYGPRCHFIHELHEKYDPSIQNVSQGTKKSKTTDLGEDTLIDKQLEDIQNQLATSLFVSDDIDNKLSSPILIRETNSSFSSGSSSPVTVSSSSTSSYTSTSNSASVSSCTSPILNRVVKKPKNSNSVFDSKMKNIFDGALEEQSPMNNTPRTRSSTSSTSSACSSTSSSSFELEEISNHQSELVKQQEQRPKPIKNLGPIGRPSVQSPNPRVTFDIERINNLLMQQNQNTIGHGSSNQTSNSFTKNFLADNSPQNNGFFNNQLQNNESPQFNGYNINYNQQTSQLSRQSSWQ